MRMNFNVLKSTLSSNLNDIYPSIESDEKIKAQFNKLITSDEQTKNLMPQQKNSLWKGVVGRKADESAKNVFTMYLEHINSNGLFAGEPNKSIQPTPKNGAAD